MTININYMRTVLLFLAFLISINIQSQVEIKPDDRDDFAIRVNYEFNNDNWEKGKNVLDEGMKKHPEDSDLRMLLGKYYLHHERYDNSRYELIKALEQNPDNVDAKQILVNVEMATKRYSSAICYINELLEVNPYWKGLWQKKIELYRLQGNTVESNRLLKRINQIYPQDTILFRDYLYEMEKTALISAKEGNLDESITLRTELMRAEPENPHHYINLANDYQKSGDNIKALVTIERGITYSPTDMDLILKKVGLLSEQRRYTELLSFLQEQIQLNNSVVLQRHYRYHLNEAALNARENEPSTLYGKVLAADPGNTEAFRYMYNHLYERQQYEEAIQILNSYRNVRGDTKELFLLEVKLHKKMGNTGRVSNLIKLLFYTYNDEDLREEYVLVMAEEAKMNIEDELYVNAIDNLREVVLYGDEVMQKHAQNSIFSASLQLNDFATAMTTLNQIILEDPSNPVNYLKRADLYYKMELHRNAFEAYEQALSLANDEERLRYLSDFCDMATLIIQSLNSQFKYDDAIDYTNMWLEQDPTNNQALKYAVNLSNQINNKSDMLLFAQRGIAAYPDDLFFKIKIAEYELNNPELYEELHGNLHLELRNNPYHEGLINTFSQLSENYASKLIKDGNSNQGIVVLDSALLYNLESKSLKYLKGVAYEKLQLYDSAHYYQSFYEPSLLELSEFKQHFNYLNYKSYKNEVAIYHLRSRPGHSDIISTVSTIEYSRFEDVNTYVGRLNYTGRGAGKGFQVQGEWSMVWDEHTYTKIDLAVANKFFPRLAFNASIFRGLKNFHDLELELGVGYKYLSNSEISGIIFSDEDSIITSLSRIEQPHLANVVVGLTKETDQWRLNLRFHNYLLNSVSTYSETHLDLFTGDEYYVTAQSAKSSEWLYNVTGQVRYYLSSPKSYIMALAGVGTAPDVELINYQLLDNFTGVNTMVGAGIAHMITKTVSAGIIGTAYNYPVEYEGKINYSNLYNIYLNLNVVF